MKKIKQVEENEKKQTERDGLSRLEVFFFNKPSTIAFLEPITLDTASSRFAAYTYHYASHYLATIFRPPKQVA